MVIRKPCLTNAGAEVCHLGNGDEMDPLVLAENKQIHDTVREERNAATHSGWIELFRPGPNLRRLTLALWLPAAQQLSGINAITYCKCFLLKVKLVVGCWFPEPTAGRVET